MPAVQRMHASREPVHRRTNDEVVVVRHQAEGVDDPVPSLLHLSKEPKKPSRIDFVAEDGNTAGPACGGVEDTVGQIATRSTRHGSTEPAGPPTRNDRTHTRFKPGREPCPSDSHWRLARRAVPQ